MADKKEVVAVEKPLAALDFSALEGLKDLGIDANIGLEAMDASDLKITVYSMGQPLSAHVTSGACKGGDFWNATTKENLGNELDVVILSITKQRVRWPENFKRDSKPLCRSFDSIHGQGLPGGDCAKCPMKEWGEGADGRPECDSGYTVLAYDLKAQIPFRIGFFGSFVAPMKKFYTSFKTSPCNKFPMFAFKQRWKSEMVQGSQGTYFVPTMPNFVSQVGLLGTNTAEEVQGFYETIKGLSDMMKKDFESDNFFVEEPTDSIAEGVATVEDKSF